MTEPAKPTKEFFSSQPEAYEIRRLTLIGIGSCIARLHGDESAPTTAELLGAVSALRKWQVVEDVHAKGDNETSEEMAAHQKAIMSNPRLAAEFVAGQFLVHLRVAEGLTGPGQAVLNEHDELDRNQRQTSTGQVRKLDMETAPASVREYAAQLGSLGMLMHMLDHEGGRAHDEVLAAGLPYRHPLLNES